MSMHALNLNYVQYYVEIRLRMIQMLDMHPKKMKNEDFIPVAVS